MGSMTSWIQEVRFMASTARFAQTWFAVNDQ